MVSRFSVFTGLYTVVGSKSEYGCVFARVISLVLVYSAESSNLEVPQNNFYFTSPCSP